MPLLLILILHILDTAIMCAYLRLTGGDPDILAALEELLGYSLEALKMEIKFLKMEISHDLKDLIDFIRSLFRK